jgi:hypothetical protein
VAANDDDVVPASALREAQQRIRELEGLLGRKQMEVEIREAAQEVVKKGRGCAKGPRSDGPPVAVICRTLGLARQTAYYTPTARTRGHYRRAVDGTVLQQIRAVTNSRATYEYRRVWAMVNRQFRAGYNRKRMRRVMRMHGLMLAPRVHRRLAFGIVRGEILRAPRHGVWSFHHDDEMRYRGGPPAFWEIYRGDPDTGVVLQRVTERLDGGVVLRKRAFDTVLHSYTRNWDVGLFGCAAWPADVCRDLVAGKDEYLDAAPSASTAPIFPAPSNREMLRFAVTLARNYLRHCIRGRRSTSQLE